MRRLAAIFGAALIFWVMFCFGFGVGRATAAPGDELAVETAAWIGTTVGAPPMFRALVPVEAEETDAGTIVGYVSSDRPGEAQIMRQYLGAWSRAAAGAEQGPLTADAAATVLHELLHRGPVVGWDIDPYLEEGITEAVTEDLLPAWSQHFLGYTLHPWEVAPSYTREVTYIRHQSARATGSSWRSRAARLWRRAFYLADRSGRLSMIPERGGA